jgi:CheY-like chemotaxis protein
MDTNPFTLLKNTVRVLVVDDMPAIAIAVRDFLELFQIYSVDTANSTREALNILEKTEKRYHACLFDLGMDDVEGDEFYLLDRYKGIIPFIIFSSREDTDRGFKSGKRGAKAFVCKTTVLSFNYNDLITSLNKYTLHNILCPEYDESGKNNICKYLDTLIKKIPVHVQDWARELDLSDRQIRYVWEEHLGFNPKHTLCVFQIISGLFAQINSACVDNAVPDAGRMDQCGRILMQSPDFKRWLEYYFLNIKEISASISRLYMPQGPQQS